MRNQGFWGDNLAIYIRSVNGDVVKIINPYIISRNCNRLTRKL